MQGSTAAFTRIKNELGRDDILLIAGVPAEDPADIADAAAIVLGVDEINGGYQIVETVSECDCDVLAHSFARHMSYETIVACYNILKEECEDAGKKVAFFTINRGISGCRHAGGLRRNAPPNASHSPGLGDEFPIHALSSHPSGGSVRKDSAGFASCICANPPYLPLDLIGFARVCEPS